MFDFAATILKTIAVGVTSVLVFLGITDPTPSLVERNNEKSALSQELSLKNTANNPQEKTEGVSTTSDESIKKEEAEKDPPTTTSSPKEPTSTNISAEAPSSSDTQANREILSGNVVNDAAREAVVNLFCISANTGVFNPVSGSGTIIDSRGVILTNAHVAQYFLLDTYQGRDFMDCVVRTGSPARVAYQVKPLYISSTWIDENAHNIQKEDVITQGEYDFAFLLITDTTNKARELPESFPALDVFPTLRKIQKGDPVLAASYPSGFLGGISISKGLWMSTSISSIKDLFTFASSEYRPLDLISLSGIISAQKGSSGGAVVSMYDKDLIGVITVSTNEETTGERELGALTIGHIERTLHKETGFGVSKLLEGDLGEKAERFASTTAPRMKEKLEEGLAQ